MAQKQEFLKYGQGYLQQLMEETVRVRLYVRHLHITVKKLLRKIEDGNDWNIYYTLEPFKRNAPAATKFHNKVIIYVTTKIEELCITKDPCELKQWEKMLEVMDNELRDTEFMFDHTKLSELPDWQENEAFIAKLSGLPASAQVEGSSGTSDEA